MPASSNSGPGKEFAQTKIQLTESARDEGPLFGDAKNFLSKRRRIFDGGVAKQSGVQVWGCPGDAHERNVDSIRGCSGDHAENEVGFSVHEVCFSSSARRFKASKGFSRSMSPR